MRTSPFSHTDENLRYRPYGVGLCDRPSSAPIHRMLGWSDLRCLDALFVRRSWQRLALIRERAPNILMQMLLRGANGVGYTNYPDNVVRFFVREAAKAGVDIFRVFDCLNWVENMRVAIDAGGEAGKVIEGAVCYTGDILDPKRSKYSPDYYVKSARE